MGSFLTELKRRNVFRVAVLYGVVAWLILQVSDVAVPALRLPEWTLSLVLFLLAIGFLVALIVAWAFELTPEGLKRTREVDPDESITPVTGQKINNLIIGVLAVAVAYLLVDKFLLSEDIDGQRQAADEGASTSEPVALTSIAVLPFVNMSADPEQEYFADGISEELLNLLAKIEDFKVAGRTSSFAFKGKNDDLRVIADKLGVATILEGSVRKDGDQVRVTAQLVKADDGYHLWSETYDRKLDSIFAIQDEIAGKVVTSLKSTLLNESDGAEPQVQTVALARERPTENMEAYTSYLRGQHLIKKRTGDDMFKALREFRYAVDLDPEFAEAHVGVASGYTLLANYGYRNFDEVAPLADASLDKALSLNPDLGEAWATKSLVLQLRGGALEDRIELLEKAVALNPNDAQSLAWLAGDYSDSGRADDALTTYERAYGLDPLSPIIIFNLATQYKARDRDRDAAKLADELEALMPDQDTPYRLRAQLAWMDGDYVAQTRWFHRALTADPRSVPATLGLAERAWQFGAYQAAENLARQTRELSPSNTSAVATLSWVMRMQGRAEDADELLAHSLELYPEDETLIAERADVALLDANFGLFLSLMKKCAPSLFTSPPRVRFGPGFSRSPSVAWAHRLAGENEKSEALLVALEDFATPHLRRFPPAAGSWLGAHVAAARGDVDELQVHLRALLDKDGQFEELLTKPLFQAYADNPDVAAIFAQMREADRNAREQLAAEGIF